MITPSYPQGGESTQTSSVSWIVAVCSQRYRDYQLLAHPDGPTTTEPSPPVHSSAFPGDRRRGPDRYPCEPMPARSHPATTFLTRSAVCLPWRESHVPSSPRWCIRVFSERH